MSNAPQTNSSELEDIMQGCDPNMIAQVRRLKIKSSNDSYLRALKRIHCETGELIERLERVWSEAYEANWKGKDDEQ